MKESYSRYTIDRNKRLGKYISLEYYGFPKRDNANRLDQKRLNIISKRDIIGDSGIKHYHDVNNLIVRRYLQVYRGRII